MYLVYEYNPYGADEIIGYVRSKKEFTQFCTTLGLEEMKQGKYGKYIGNGYYTDVHYIEKISKCA